MTEQSMIVTGLRGVGKTVLLGKFERTAQERGWVVIDAEVTKHDETDFRRNVASWARTALFTLSPAARWNDRVKRAGSVLKSFTLSADPNGGLTAGMNVDPQPGVPDQGMLANDLTDLFVAVGEAARDQGRGIVFLLDEIQFLSRSQLEALFTALHKTVQRTLPITLVGAGLPQIAELAGQAKSYSERLFVFPAIGNLEPPDARRALAEPAGRAGVSWSDGALEVALEVTDGYPYFLQELGYAVWPIAQAGEISERDVRDAMPQYQAKLDASFFRVRLDRATELQRAYLRAMAALGPLPQKAADVASQMDRKSTQVGPIRAELINMGLLYAPQHGYAAFTVPHFDQFMLRAIPRLEVPPVRRSRRSQ